MMKRLVLLSLLLLVVNGCGDSSGEDATCGDGVVDSSEVCDDGNMVGGDGCSTSCLVEAGYTCVTATSSFCSTTCGDGIVAGAEACDDGNTDSGDGCDATCASESAGTTETNCDNGVDDDADGRTDCDDTDCAASAACGGAATEQACDDGQDNDGDGATDCDDTDCADDAACGGTCGNGVVDDGEACDNGDANSDTEADACRLDCTLAGCGDGVVDAGEACDDGAANALGGACLPDCDVSPTALCEGTGFAFLNAVGNPIAVSGIEYVVSLATGGPDVVQPSAACEAGNGPEMRLAFRVPEDGAYVVEVDDATSTVGTTTYLLNDCNGGGELACSSANGRSPHGRVFFNGRMLEDWFIVIDADDASANGTATVRVRKVDAVLAEGDTCNVDDPQNLCGTGLSCIDAQCSVYEPTVAGLGEACDVAGIDPVCAVSAFCDADAAVCTANVGASCATAVDLGADWSADELSATVTAGQVFDDATVSCSTAATTAAFVEFVAPADGVISATSFGAGVGADSFLAAQTTCGGPETELGCASATDESVVDLEFAVQAGQSYSLVLGATGDANVVLSFTPYVALGEPCDPGLVSSRCEPPLVCGPLETCMEPIAASCGDPINVLESGSGTSVFDSRGLIVGFDTRDGVNETNLSCADFVSVNEAVLQLSGLGDADVLVEVRSPGARMVAEVREACSDPASALFCDVAPEELVRSSFVTVADQDYFVVIEGYDGPVAGTVNVRATRIAGVGDSCAAAACREGLVCNASNICVGTNLSPGAPCGPSIGTCTDGVDCIAGICVRSTAVCDPADPDSCPSADNVCVEFFDLIYCSARQTDETGACDDVLVTCEPGLNCELVAGETYGTCVRSGGDDTCETDANCGANEGCLIESGAANGVCVNEVADRDAPCNATSVTCTTGNVCIGYADDGVGTCLAPLDPGTPCVPEEGDDQCVAFFVCNAASGNVCDFPAERTPAGENCFANPACEDGFLCWPVTPELEWTPESVCEPALPPGSACTADPSAGVCFPPAQCISGTCSI